MSFAFCSTLTWDPIVPSSQIWQCKNSTFVKIYTSSQIYFKLCAMLSSWSDAVCFDSSATVLFSTVTQGIVFVLYRVDVPWWRGLSLRASPLCSCPQSSFPVQFDGCFTSLCLLALQVLLCITYSSTFEINGDSILRIAEVSLAWRRYHWYAKGEQGASVNLLDVAVYFRSG